MIKAKVILIKGLHVLLFIKDKAGANKQGSIPWLSTLRSNEGVFKSSGLLLDTHYFL